MLQEYKSFSGRARGVCYVHEKGPAMGASGLRRVPVKLRQVNRVLPAERLTWGAAPYPVRFSYQHSSQNAPIEITVLIAIGPFYVAPNRDLAAASKAEIRRSRTAISSLKILFSSVAEICDRSKEIPNGEIQKTA